MTRQDAIPHGARGTRPAAAVGGAAVLVLALLPRVSAGAEEAFRCQLTESPGVVQADATTATTVVCDQLRRESGGRGAFKLTLGTLGRLVVVSAIREDTAESVTVQVQGLEELPVAAERIAESLLRRRAFAKTQRVDNLLETETRLALTKQGSVKFSVGVADLESLGHAGRGAGFSLGLVYATPVLALPVEMRFGWDDASYDEPGIGLFSLSVGARRYLSKQDTSPFFGGGLGILNLSARDEGHDDHRFGASGYLEAGVEILRLHRGRIGLQLRADLPFGSLRGERYVDYGYPGDSAPAYVQHTESQYVVPVTIGLNVAF